MGKKSSSENFSDVKEFDNFDITIVDCRPAFGYDGFQGFMDIL
jgi:hypothetical protein